MTKREFLDIVFALAPNEANAIMDAFDEYADSNEPHWIPVTEKLPEEEGEYLVTSVYQYYRDGRKTYKTTVDRWSRNGVGKEWVATSNDAHIAWMPLPEPYKGVTT